MTILLLKIWRSTIQTSQTCYSGCEGHFQSLMIGNRYFTCKKNFITNYFVCFIHFFSLFYLNLLWVWQFVVELTCMYLKFYFKFSFRFLWLCRLVTSANTHPPISDANDTSSSMSFMNAFYSRDDGNQLQPGAVTASLVADKAGTSDGDVHF